jgi:hypothetical protein
MEFSEYNRGVYDNLIQLSNAYYGKQMYFKQDNLIVYSRASTRYMNIIDAVSEFEDILKGEYN